MDTAIVAIRVTYVGGGEDQDISGFGTFLTGWSSGSVNLIAAEPVETITFELHLANNGNQQVVDFDAASLTVVPGG